MHYLARRKSKKRIRKILSLLPRSKKHTMKEMLANHVNFVIKEKEDAPLFSSIAISGPPGAGRSTLYRNLQPILRPHNWDSFSGGEWARQFAIRLGNHDPDDNSHHNAMDYGEYIDLLIDRDMRKKLENSQNHVLVESWIAGWNMRNLNHVLKILLICDEALRIDRIVNRDNLPVLQAKTHTQEREKTNFKKWQRMYQTSDFWHPKYHDLVIDTYANGAQETLKLVLDRLFTKLE